MQILGIKKQLNPSPNIEIQIELIAFSYFASTMFGLASLIPGGIGVSEISKSLIIRNIDDSLDLNLVNAAILGFRTILLFNDPFR